MSTEALEIVRKLNIKYPGMQLIMQCAPLIAHLKVSNLLKISKNEEKDVLRLLRYAGISYYELLDDGRQVTLFVFRREELLSFLDRRENREFLKTYGYEMRTLPQMLFNFRKRYRQHIADGSGFPHEIGLFLGYPLEDIVGFISHGGKNYRASGYWKVYANVEETLQLFAAFDTAREDMLRSLDDGVPIDKILDCYSQCKQFSIAV